MYNKVKDRDIFMPAANEDLGDFVTKMPADFYTFRTRNVGMFGKVVEFQKMTEYENLQEVNSDVFISVEHRIMGHFMNKNIELFKELKVKNSLAALFHGPPGTGKTCFSVSLARKLIKKNDAVAIKIFPYDSDYVDEIIRLSRLNSDRIVVLLFDEFEEHLRRAGSNRFIELLDGYHTKNNVLFLMTTNFLDRIPEALRLRPSRIKIIEEIKNIPVDVAITLIKDIIPEKYHEKLDISKLSVLMEEHEIKIDQAKHLALDILSEDKSPEEAIEALAKLNELEDEARKKEEE